MAFVTKQPTTTARGHHVIGEGLPDAVKSLRRILSTRWALAKARLRSRGSVAMPGDWKQALERDGVVAVPNFWNEQQCRTAIEEFRRLVERFPDYVLQRSDRRLFGANNASSVVRGFAEDPRLVAAAQAFYGDVHTSCVTLAAHLPSSAGNLGSGEGWHRDSLTPQFKSILYLTDVDESNGPFQLVEGSHRWLAMLRDNARLGVASRVRLSDDEVRAIVAKSYPRGVRTFTGEAGFLILVSTSALHRGKPIERGERFALTNYFYAGAAISEERASYFKRLLPHDDGK
jgi:hypothetical protein